MKLLTMKALSVAMFGLASLAVSSGAFAVCTANADPASPNGAWDSKNVVTGTTLAVAAPGLNGTNCSLQISIAAGAAANTHGYVSNTTSAVNEAHYRARFYIDLSTLTGLNSANQQFEMFDAFSNTAPGTFNTDEIQIYMVGNTAVRFLVSDSSLGSGTKIITVNLPTGVASKNYRIEFDLQTGAPGSFRYWVTDAAAVTADTGLPTANPAGPNGTYAPQNAGWSGIVTANLGLYSTSAQFRANVAAQNFRVDEFDSRRSSFIGK